MPLPTALPAPRTPDPREAPPLRWGILGTGWIAERLVTALQRHTAQRVTAVGSRTRRSADAFADRLGVSRRHGSYAELVNDPEVDVVYVATPHNHHHRDALLAVRAGKHVLVEKPMGVSAEQARDIAAEAARHGVMAMEALWTFFLPKFDVLTQLLDDGALGTVLTVLADHGQHFESGHRILDPALAGGPMLDLMTYPASFAHRVLGAAVSVDARTTWAPSGVTGQTAITYANHDGAQAVLHSSVVSRTPTTAAACGDAAMIEIDADFYTPGGFTLSDHEGNRLRYDEEPVAHTGGLHFQACAMARAIAAGETSCDERPLDAIIGTLAIMDAARRIIGETFEEPEG